MESMGPLYGRRFGSPAQGIRRKHRLQAFAGNILGGPMQRRALMALVGGAAVFGRRRHASSRYCERSASCSKRHEFERESCARGAAIFQRDRRGMQLGDALNDRKPQACAPWLPAIASPEALKNEVALLLGDAWSVVQNAHRPIVFDDEFHGRSRRGMVD